MYGAWSRKRKNDKTFYTKNYLQKWRHINTQARNIQKVDSDVESFHIHFSSGDENEDLGEDFEPGNNLNNNDNSASDSENILESENSQYTSSESDIGLDEYESDDFNQKLSQWVIANGVTNQGTNDLLQILRKKALNLPKDCRTLKQTPSEIEIQQKCGGDYYYFGLLSGISKLLSKDECFCEINDELKLLVNIDGVPLFKSNNLQMWPILCALGSWNPFIVAIYCGYSKPNDVDEYLYDFLEEYKILQNDGLIFNGKNFKVSIRSFICDAPARAFIKGIKSHSGYYSCERCNIRGSYVNSCVVLHNRDSECDARTDEQFLNQAYTEHQVKRSPLIDCGISCIKGFSLDYMHLVCLGVVKRLLYFWKGGPRNTSLCSLSQAMLRQIDGKLLSFKGRMPSEFSRQPRSVYEYDRWKATEFRQFVLYTGPVALKGILQEEAYTHFMTLSVALSLMLQEDRVSGARLRYARDLVLYFVNKSVFLYGQNFPVYNVHCLTHIWQDIEFYDCSLNEISAFQFENHLKTLKRMIRGTRNPVAQICKRLGEFEKSRAVTSNAMSKRNRISTATASKDNCFLLQNGTFAFVKELLQDNEVLIKILKLRNTENFFKEPCESKQLSVAFVTKVNLRQQAEVKVVQRDELKRKVVCLPYRDTVEGWVLFPLLHS